MQVATILALAVVLQSFAVSMFLIEQNVGVRRVFGNCLEGIWQLSGRCLVSVWKVSKGCLEGACI